VDGRRGGVANAAGGASVSLRFAQLSAQTPEVGIALIRGSAAQIFREYFVHERLCRCHTRERLALVGRGPSYRCLGDKAASTHRAQAYLRGMPAGWHYCACHEVFQAANDGAQDADGTRLCEG